MKHKLIALSLVVAAFSGCTEKKEMEFSPVDESGYTLICADIQSLLMMEDKRVWPEDAAIGVYGSEKGNNECYTIKNAGAGYSSAEFYGPWVKGKIAAYYPYSSNYVASVDAMPVTIEDQQVFNPQVDVIAHYLEYTPMAFGYMKNDKIEFVYPNGVLNITFEGNEPVYITDISVSSESQKLAGLAVFKADGSLAMTNNSFDTVVLDCGEGAPSIVNGKKTEFNLVFAPGTYSDLRLAIGFRGNDKKFLCAVPEVTIERVTAEGFTVSSMKISVPSPDGFDEVEVEFDE